MSELKDKLSQASPGEMPTGESRRAALGKLGLSVAIAYSAPVVLRIDRPAHASPISSCLPGGGDPGPDPPVGCP